MTWDIKTAQEVARSLAVILNLADERESERLVNDYRRVLDNQPGTVRVAFMSAFAMTASPKALERFFGLNG